MKPSWITKLERASAHLKLLQHEIGDFANSGAYHAALDPHPELFQPRLDEPPVGFLYRLRAYALQDAPETWHPIIGECLYDFRSALDHIAFALAGNDAGSHTEFPVFTDALKYGQTEPSGKPYRGSGLQKTVGMSWDAQALIESLQPYHRPDWQRTRHPLALLHELMIEDKHKRPHLVGGAMAQGQSFIVVGGEKHVFGHMPYRTFENEAVLTTFLQTAAIARHFEVDFDTEITFDVAFPEDGPGQGLSVCGVLESIGTFICTQLVPELPGVGLITD